MSDDKNEIEAVQQEDSIQDSVVEEGTVSHDQDGDDGASQAPDQSIALEKAVNAGEYDQSIKNGLKAALKDVEALKSGQSEDSGAEDPAPEDGEDPADAPKSIMDEPYRFSECTITVSITFLADDGDPAGRPVILGVRNHQDAPIIKAPMRESDLGDLPPFIKDLLTEIELALPNRYADKVKNDAKRSKIRTRNASAASKNSAKKPAQTPRSGNAAANAASAKASDPDQSAEKPEKQLAQMTLF